MPQRSPRRMRARTVSDLTDQIRLRLALFLRDHPRAPLKTLAPGS
jgi:hypothetical protein